MAADSDTLLTAVGGSMSVFSVTRFSIHNIIYYTDPTFKGNVIKDYHQKWY